VLADLALAPDLAEALLNPAAEGNRLAAVYRLVLAYERGQWDWLPALAQCLGLPLPQLSEWYLEAVTASNDALEVHSPQPCCA
jgi:hypothetical protein